MSFAEESDILIRNKNEIIRNKNGNKKIYVSDDEELQNDSDVLIRKKKSKNNINFTSTSSLRDLEESNLPSVTNLQIKNKNSNDNINISSSSSNKRTPKTLSLLSTNSLNQTTPINILSQEVLDSIDADYSLENMLNNNKPLTISTKRTSKKGNSIKSLSNVRTIKSLSPSIKLSYKKDSISPSKSIVLDLSESKSKSKSILSVDNYKNKKETSLKTPKKLSSVKSVVSSTPETIELDNYKSLSVVNKAPTLFERMKMNFNITKKQKKTQKQIIPEKKYNLVSKRQSQSKRKLSFSKFNKVKINKGHKKTVKNIDNKYKKGLIKTHSNKKHSNKKHSNKKHSNKKHSNKKHSNKKHSNKKHSNKKHSNKKHSNKKHSNKKHSNKKHSNKNLNISEKNSLNREYKERKEGKYNFVGQRQRRTLFSKLNSIFNKGYTTIKRTAKNISNKYKKRSSKIRKSKKKHNKSSRKI
jgi:hypothetical protein